MKKIALMVARFYSTCLLRGVKSAPAGEVCVVSEEVDAADGNDEQLCPEPGVEED